MASSWPRCLLLAIFLLNWDLSFSSKIGKGYKLLSLEQTPDGGLLGLLQVKVPNSIYGPDIPTLKLFVKHETRDRLRVHVTDSEHPRWEVPYSLLPRQQPPTLTQPLASTSSTSHVYAGDNLVFSVVPDPFGFSVSRKTTGETLFDTTSHESDPFGEMVFKDQYLEISTRLPESASLYGLGENTQPHGIKLFPGDPYTLYTTDISAISLNTDLYGSHPVYMDLRNGSAHAVLLLSSNGMDVFYRGSSLTYKVIGGVFDFFFFAGPDPLSVVDQYTQLIGRPAAMPYWAFGFHQCRWGYHNLSVVENVVESYRKAEIPLDVIWNDDDHMDGHKDFTLNPVSYPRNKLAAFLEKIHAIGMKYIVLIDPGIAVNSSYGVYQRGIAKDVFIKYGGKPFLAQVWPGPVNFPDFLNPDTVTWWADEIRRFHDMVPVDGLWIDMNEASNFCSGLCTIPTGKQCPSGTGPGWICCLDCKNITATKWDDPPYKINASGSSVPIGYKTIATSAYHYNGVLEYDAHSIYGFSQAVATRKALLGLQGKRPFILSRSTFVGSGKYAAHWTGDNKATWHDLKYSVSTMLNFGIFGIPMVGADICGFYPAPSEELCNRWIELGAFYPFARDHANFYSPRQELYQWKSVATSARTALGLRYKLLPYLYTLNYEAHSTGAPIARPLFFTFPNFPDCYSLSTQFLLGRSLMVSPVLEKGERHVTVLFPPGSWYSMFDMTKVVVASRKGRSVAIEAPLNVVNVHLYEGTVLPMQKGGLISKDVKKTPFTLIVSFPAGCTEGEAKGTLYADDDDSPEMVGSYVEFHADVADGRLRVRSVVQNGGFALEKGLVIDAIVVLGLGAGRAEDVEVDGMGLTHSSTLVVNISQQKFAIDIEDIVDKFLSSAVVEFTGLNILVGKEFVFSSRIGRG